MQSCRFDQSGYPVDETVNEVNNPVVPKHFSQIPLCPVLPTGFPPPYPLDPNFINNTGVRPNISQLHSLPAQPVGPWDNRFIPPLPAPNPVYLLPLNVSSDQPHQHPSQFITRQQRPQTSSFSINQHIGLNEPPVVNASQLNNSIKVQYQFSNNDRFAVQSTSTRESNDSAFLSWQNLSDAYQSQRVTDSRQTVPNQPNIVSENNQQKSSDHSEVGQYFVFNIPRKDGANVGINSNGADSLPDSLEKAKDNLDPTLEIGKDKQKKQIANLDKKGLTAQRQNSDNGVKFVNRNQCNNIDRQETVDRLNVGQVRNANKVNSVDNQCKLDNNQDTEIAKKQEEKRASAASLDKNQTLESSIKKQSQKKTSVNRKGNGKTADARKGYKKAKSTEKKSTSKGKNPSDKVTLLKLTYQCGECTNVYYEIENLIKHLKEKHPDEVRDEGTGFINNKTATEEPHETDINIITEKAKNIEKNVGDEINANSKEREKNADNVNEDLRQMEGLEGERMAGENVEQELLEVESENIVSEPECFLCPLCAYTSKSLEEEESHQRMHDVEAGSEKTGECHDKGEAYLTKYIEMVEHRQKNDKERDALEAREQEVNKSAGNAKISKVSDDELPKKRNSSGPKSKKVSDSYEPASDLIEISLEKNRTGLRKRQVTQAKNNLMNPSKGKQKRIRDTQNFGKEDRMLMEMFGIIPSNVCLSRVENSDDIESKNRKNTTEEPNFEKENRKKDSENLQEDSVTRNKKVERNHWNKVLNMNNCEGEDTEESVLNKEIFNNDSDSDVEIVEPPVTLIVLDDEVNTESEKADDFSRLSLEDIEKDSQGKKSEKCSPKKLEKDRLKKSEKCSPKKSVKESPGKFEKASPRKTDKDTCNTAVTSKNRKECVRDRDVSTDIRKGEVEEEISKRSKSDAELLEQYGIKNLRVNLTNTPPKIRRSKPGPKAKFGTRRTQEKAKENKSSNEIVKDIEEMSPSEIEKLLYECGMGITVPFKSKISRNEKESPCRSDQTPSPVPSTSKGHGHLKRKRTARKSTKDSALFKKYKLKDSKVIIENLSRIDISLIRNPNSPFGKSDWLKHKFDSDTESDFEFDIPTPPLVEDFVESEVPPRNDKQKAINLNTQNLTPLGKTGRKSPLKQRELQIMEKFGISESVVVIDSPRKSQNVKESKSIKKKTISDEELRKKFGIPNTMVVINTPEKTKESPTNSSCGKLASESKQNKITFADFKLALDSARKNILSNMKACSKPDSIEQRKISPRNKELSKQMENKLTRNSKKKVEQKNDVDCKLKDSNNETSLARRKLRTHLNANETITKSVLPYKLKTLTVDINKLKLNETCKTFKARAVLRAIEATRKRDRIARKFDSKVYKDTNKGQQRTLITSRKRLREKVSEDQFEKSSKRKRLECKGKEVGSKELKFKREILVVKTARYRRSVLADKTMDKTSKKVEDLKQLAKGLPVVKVTVPCLTNEQIVRLSQNIDDPPVSIKNNVDLNSVAVANEIISEIIDKICLSYDCSCKKSELPQSDSVEDTFEGDTMNTTSGSGDGSVTDTNMESNFISGEKKSYSVIEDASETYNLVPDSRKIESDIDNCIRSEKTDVLHEVGDSESDLSLISITTLENKENENDSFTCSIKEGGDEDNANKGLDKNTCQMDVIPLGKIKVYDEDKYEHFNVNLSDEVDGDAFDNTRISQDNYDKVDSGTFEADQEDQVKEKDAEVQSNGETEESSKMDDANDEKENRIDDEICEGETDESSNTFKIPIKDNDNVSKDNSVVKMQILSAIIDSESGSLIGDVYTVHESAGNSSDGDKQEKGGRKEMDFSINLMENVSRMPRSSSPDDVIQTLTES